MSTTPSEYSETPAHEQAYMDLEVPAPVGALMIPNLRPALLQRMQLVCSYSYSRRWNTRRLESLSYGLWNQVLNCLIGEIVNFVVIPQLDIYDPKNVNVDPDSSVGTFPGSRTGSGIPDFAVAMLTGDPALMSSTTLDEVDFTMWNQRTILYAELPILTELKRVIGRSITHRFAFDKELTPRLREAMLQLNKYSNILFSDSRRRQNAVLLLAVSGEWWHFRIAVHPKSTTVAGKIDQVLAIPDEEEDEGPDSFWSSLAGESESDDSAYMPEPGEKIPASSPRPLLRHVKAEEEKVKKNIEDAWPARDQWSLRLLLGSPASNQRMALIRKWLTEFQANNGHVVLGI